MTKAKRPKPTHVELDAYHEAGHAVIAHHLGLRVLRVAVRPDGPGSSVTTIGRAPDRFLGRELEDAALVEYLDIKLLFHHAGCVAERVHAKSRMPKNRVHFWRLTDAHYAEQDVLMTAYALGRGPTKNEIKATVAGYKTHTRALVRKLWPMVETVARALLKHKMLGARRFRTLVGPKAL